METWPKAIHLRNVPQTTVEPEIVHHDPAPIPVEVPMAIEVPPLAPPPPEPAPVAVSAPNPFA